MRKHHIFRKIIALGTVAAMSCLTGAGSLLSAAAESDTADVIQVTIDPAAHSTFHDTDGDGWGEFQGFGTSLCWWANRVGYDESLTEQAVSSFYDEKDGLGMTIGRYNIGGGDAPGHDHIQRSDSVIPGYATDVKKIKKASDAKGFDQYDLKCGYAWNYDWNADKNQLNVLKAAIKKAGSDFIAQAFSNSPPYFMTNSNCSSGGEKGDVNLRKDSYEAFAKYLTDVTKHLIKEGIPIESMTGMNEPDSGWTAFSPKQEGCRIPQGETQSKLLVALNNRMKKQGLQSVVLSGCDEVGTSQSTAGYKALSDQAKKAVQRIDTHTYATSKMKDLRVLALTEKKNLWMSEMDGKMTKGYNAGQMSAALGLGYNISSQMNALLPSAWILWNAIDIHVDQNNPFDKNTLEAIGYSSLDSKGFWGLAVADHNNKKVLLTKKYYAFGQYSRYIRPGYTILELEGKNLAAYDKKSQTLVIVAENIKAQDMDYRFDLSNFENIDETAAMQVIRTSGTLADGENWADVSKEEGTQLDVANKTLTTKCRGNSITTYIIKGVTLKAKDQGTPNNKTDEITAPSKVTGVKAVNHKKKIVTVSWKKVAGADGYVVYRASKKNGTMKAVKTVSSQKITNYTDKKVVKGKSYYYSIRAFCRDGNQKIYSKQYSTKAKVVVRK